MSSFTQYVLYIEEVNSMHIPKQTLYYVMLQYIIQSAKNIAQHCAISFYILTSMANSITKAVLRYGPLLWQTRTFIYTAVYLIYVLHYWAKASRVIFFWFARGVDFISISVYCEASPSGRQDQMTLYWCFLTPLINMEHLPHNYRANNMYDP